MSTRKPNVLLMICHDLGRFLGCYGIKTLHTPNLDRLAAEGVRFAEAFCAAPQCSPSRAALFTGRYPHCNGVMGLTHANFAWDLYPDERHLAQILKEEGYATSLIGVHHESRTGSPEQVAARCGFDVVQRAGQGESLAERVIELIKGYARQDRPFYLELSFAEPHRMGVPEGGDYSRFTKGYFEPDDSLGVTVPPYIRDTERAREEMAELQGSVRYLDGCVGRVLSALRDLGIEEETLVIFTTDHGLALPRAKCSVYDPGIQIALIMRYPAGGITGGRTFDEMIPNVDVFATVLDVVGIPPAPNVQGKSFLPLIKGEAYEPHEEIYAEMTYHDYYDPRRCIRTKRWKLIANFSAAYAFMDPSQSWRPRMDTVVPENPKGAYHPHFELYDLENDPYEWENLADNPDFAEIRRDLAARLYNWMEETNDPILQGAVTSPMHTAVVESLRRAATGASGVA